MFLPLCIPRRCGWICCSSSTSLLRYSPLLCRLSILAWFWSSKDFLVYRGLPLLPGSSFSSLLLCPLFLSFSGFCLVTASPTLSSVMSSGMFNRTNLVFFNFWIFTSYSSQFALISSPSFSTSFSELVSIITLPSLNCLSELIPTFMSVGITFDSIIFSIVPGDWLVFDLSVNLCFFSVLCLTTVE